MESAVRSYQCVTQASRRFYNFGMNPTLTSPDKLFHSALRFVNLQFSFKNVYYEYDEIDQYSTELWREQHGSLIQKTVRVPHRFLMSSNDDDINIHEILDKQLMGLPIPEDWRKQMIMYGLPKARESVLSLPSTKNYVLDLSVKFIIRHYHMYPMSDVTQNYGMVPATDSSIEVLKTSKVVIDHGTTNCDKSCTICLEEFSIGDEAACMPCSHKFHDGCIKEWLRTSHYCPLCRYEMPTK